MISLKAAVLYHNSTSVIENYIRYLERVMYQAGLPAVQWKLKCLLDWLSAQDVNAV